MWDVSAEPVSVAALEGGVVRSGMPSITVSTWLPQLCRRPPRRPLTSPRTRGRMVKHLSWISGKADKKTEPPPPSVISAAVTSLSIRSASYLMLTLLFIKEGNVKAISWGKQAQDRLRSLTEDIGGMKSNEIACRPTAFRRMLKRSGWFSHLR